jgi:RNA polymerase sigma factor (sigma-70 family)
MEPLTPEQRRLVEENMHVARERAGIICGRKAVPFDEALRHTYLALCQVARLWDPSRGVPFEMYARATVGTRSVDGFREENGNVRASLPEELQVAKWRSANPYPASCSPTELPGAVRRALTSDRGIGDLTALDLCAGGDEEAGYEEVEVQDALARALAHMGPRHRKVVHLRLQGLTLAEIGDELGVTESRICQLVNGPVRRALEAAGLGTVSA